MRSIRYHYLNVNPELITENQDVPQLKPEVSTLPNRQKSKKDPHLSSYLMTDTKR